MIILKEYILSSFRQTNALPTGMFLQNHGTSHIPNPVNTYLDVLIKIFYKNNIINNKSKM